VAKSSFIIYFNQRILRSCVKNNKKKAMGQPPRK
jgi:hypothetical protein